MFVFWDFMYFVFDCFEKFLFIYLATSLSQFKKQNSWTKKKLN